MMVSTAGSYIMIMSTQTYLQHSSGCHNFYIICHMPQPLRSVQQTGTQ